MKHVWLFVDDSLMFLTQLFEDFDAFLIGF